MGHVVNTETRNKGFKPRKGRMEVSGLGMCQEPSIAIKERRYGEKVWLEAQLKPGVCDKEEGVWSLTLRSC